MICISPPFAAIQVNLSVPERSGLRHSILANRHFGTRRTPKQSPSLAVEHHRLELAVVVSRAPFRGGQRDAVGHRVLVHYRDGLCRAHAPAAQRLLDVVRPARRWARGWPAGGRRGRGRAKRTVAFLRLRIRVCRSHHRFIKVRANGDEGRAELTWTPRLLYAIHQSIRLQAALRLNIMHDSPSSGTFELALSCAAQETAGATRDT